MASHIGQNPDVHRVPQFRSSPRHRIAALCTASAALLATTPTAAALAAATARGGGEPSISPALTRSVLPAPGELLPPGRLEELLASLPLSDLSTAQLTSYLAGLEEISVLAQLQVGLLGNEPLGLAGVEESLTKAIEQLGPSATLGELTALTGLLPTLEGQLNGLLGTLLGGVLEGEAQQGLSEALHTLSLDQLVASLLATAGEPQQLSGLSQLAGGLFEALGSGNLEELAGSTLEGPFTPTTVKGAAEQLGSTSEALSDQLGQTTTALPATATMLTAPLRSGKLLAVAPGLEGLAIGLLGGKEGEETGGGSKEGSGSGSKEGAGTGTPGPGGTGGQGGSAGNTTPGSNGSGGALTVVLNVPPGASPGASASPGARHASTTKLRLLGSKTKGAQATIVLQVPAAGRLQLRGNGLRSRTIRVSKAGRLTVRVNLSRAGLASLRHHHKRLAVELHASLRAASGGSFTAHTTLTFG